MKISHFTALLIAVASSTVAATVSAMEPGPQAQASGPSADRARPNHRAQLLTPEERTQLRERMKAAKTPEERAALRKEMHAAVEQRAREKGVTLPEHGRSRTGSPVAKLLTPEERTQFRERMKTAKDRGERQQVGKEMHALATQRAKEKGITLPEHGRRGPRSGPRDGAAPSPKG